MVVGIYDILLLGIIRIIEEKQEKRNRNMKETKRNPI